MVVLHWTFVLALALSAALCAAMGWIAEQRARGAEVRAQHAEQDRAIAMKERCEAVQHAEQEQAMQRIAYQRGYADALQQNNAQRDRQEAITAARAYDDGWNACVDKYESNVAGIVAERAPKSRSLAA